MAVSKKSTPADPPAVEAGRRPQPWWFRDVVIPLLIAGIVGGMTIWGQAIIDDDRAEREQVAAAKLSEQLSRLEDLRFIRERSADLPPLDENVPARTLPFSRMDLRGIDLSHMDLRGADFTSANLEGAILFEANLENAEFRNTNLDHANFTEAILIGADIRRSSMRGTNFSASQGGMFTEVCWDAETILPAADQLQGINMC